MYNGRRSLSGNHKAAHREHVFAYRLSALKLEPILFSWYRSEVDITVDSSPGPATPPPLYTREAGSVRETDLSGTAQRGGGAGITFTATLANFSLNHKLS